MININSRLEVLVLGKVEVSHTKLSKIPRMASFRVNKKEGESTLLFVEVDSVVVLPSSVTSTTRMLPVLTFSENETRELKKLQTNTTMTSRDVASLLSVLLQTGSLGW